MAPFDLTTTLGWWGANCVYLAVGFGFGFILERAGFGNARKLAAQFYFYDQTVLKVMFTAIVVAMLGIFWTARLGLLDMDRVWINPTYLGPAVVGGLVLGMGFIIGGYCPGTSLVAMVTLKLDGLFFVLGVVTGIFIFGETVGMFSDFWNQSGALGRLTLPEWLGVSTGSVVLGVVVMALGMFCGAEWLEKFFAGKNGKDGEDKQ